LHYATDLATNAATLTALGLASFGLHGLDPVFGLSIGIYVLYSALRIGREAVELLLVRGVHGLRTRQSGQVIGIQLHIELDDELELLQAHHIAVTVEQRIRDRWPHSDVIIHQDPASLGVDEAEPGPTSASS